MSLYPIRKTIVEEKSAADPLAAGIMERLAALTGGRPAKGAIDDLGKDVLHILRNKGVFLRPCPGTSHYICCGYRILHVGTNCPLDCSYCILQAYFNAPNLRVFSNLEENLAAVLAEIDAHPDEIFRVGTGEFTDSLALDPLTGWSRTLPPLFACRPNAILELKTKTDKIEGLLDSDVRERIIVSWSLNAPYIAAREEKRAATLTRRLEAARRCQQAGFTLGFHFDPMVEHPGWEEGYAQTVELMDRYIDPKGIIWISLGSMRCMPQLKPIILRRHPGTCVLDGEFVSGLDGKMRLFRPIRVGLYARMAELLGSWHPDLGLYLCMESDTVWRESFGWSPGDSAGLKAFLDSRVKRFFGWSRS
ncbi:SPL family radical SAM protein [Desulfatiglans anilini]|uniref:SPL family radical SAM protein n=1 Tax=Desulfatiglans anilini TaxID=90728 RepID=UPI000429B797|nr:hypothetical protein [Desulfatiglans anilini]